MSKQHRLLVTDDEQYTRQTLAIVQELLGSDNLENRHRASALSYRAVAFDNLGDDQSALRDHNEAARIAPQSHLPAILETRANFYEANGQSGLAHADRARAQELRRKLNNK